MSLIGRFYLLKNLYQKISIPEGVYNEVVEKGWGLPGSLETAKGYKEGWIDMHSVINKDKVRVFSLKHNISLVNAEVVQLAQELNASLVLVDEEEVRNACKDFDFTVSGCLGILLKATREKIITKSSAEQDVNQLINSGYRLNKSILKYFKEILRRLDLNETNLTNS